MAAPAQIVTDITGDTEFEGYLPHLLSRYQSGKLVPFVGSGLSLPVCTSWGEFVQRLCDRAGMPAGTSKAAGAGGPPPDEDPDVRVRRAYTAVRALKSRPPGEFEAAIRYALLKSEGGNPKPSASMLALGRIWWPLVLTTNYDASFEEAYDAEGLDRALAVVGRSPEDCQRVLTSFTVAGRTLLWALQGYLGKVPDFGLEDRRALEHLEKELVVGHEEYRRVTYREMHFRRAFADVFRHRSLLFLGAGLQESYLQELFGEVLETYGPSTRPHYAFLRRNSVDVAFLRARFQIFVIEYEDHAQVTTRLTRLREAITAPTWAPRRFAFGLDTIGERGDDLLAPARRGFEIITGSLPTQLEPGECIAVSAGGRSGTFAYSPPINALLAQLGALSAPLTSLSERLGRYGEMAIFAVRARSDEDEKSLLAIRESCLELFAQAEAAGFERIHLQLIAAGKNAGADIRTFPARFSLVQIVRAWGDFNRDHVHPAAANADDPPSEPSSKTRPRDTSTGQAEARSANRGLRLLSVYVKDEYVYREVAIGRIDIGELLDCPDLRFFCEILRDDGEVERRLFQKSPQAQLAEISNDLNLDASSWKARVSPSPGLEDVWFELDTVAGTPLDKLGVVSGSTIRIHRRPPPPFMPPG